jgi:hypothetical protein
MICKNNELISSVKLIPTTATKMTLSKEKLSELIENYASLIIDGLDTKDLEVMVFDLLTREYETYTEDQILGEIDELYGEEVLNDLLESVQ